MNATGAISGGARTWCLGLAEELQRNGDRGATWTFLVPPDLADSRVLNRHARVRLQHTGVGSPLKRILWEQTALLATARRHDVLVSGVNFGPLLRRRRHVVIAHNALHFSGFTPNGAMGLRLRVEAALAGATVRRAGTVVTPTNSMAALIRHRTGRSSVVLPFGPGLVVGRRERERERFTFAHRTSWGPHKRFGDLLLAVRQLARTDAGRFVVESACDPRSPFARQYAESEVERALLDDPAIASHVRIAAFDNDAGGRRLDADAVVVPSDLESFCFPLAEAMAVELPIVTVDAPFAREMCGDAALYATPGDPRALAAAMRSALQGTARVPTADDRSHLSWRRHADGLAEACHGAARS